MKRGELLSAAIGILLLAGGAYFEAQSRGPMHDELLADGCRVPVRVLKPTGGSGDRTALVFHGLAANRRIMQTLGQSLAAASWRVYLVDLPGHGDNSEPYSFARAEQCAAFVVETLSRSGEIQPEKTVLAGHSLGGAVAVRLADHFPTAATVAISPAPMVLPRRMPANLLIFSAQYDLPELKQTAARLLRAAGGERASVEDFRERRAVKLDRVAHAAHTSLLFDPRVFRLTAEWAERAVPPKEYQPQRRFSLRGVFGSLAGLLGLVLLFPTTATLLEKAFGATGVEPPTERPEAGQIVLRWVVAAFLAVSLLSFWQPLRVLGLVTGDSLAAFLLLSGAILLMLAWNQVQKMGGAPPRAIAMACALGFVTILAFGGWLSWDLSDAWLNAARWLRFPAVLVLCLPYFFAEEAALSPPSERGKPLRFALFLLLRLVLWLAQVFAYYVLSSGSVLIVLLTVYLAVFSILQRLAADAVRRRCGSAPAAAIFDAILAAWFVAAVFPLR